MDIQYVSVADFINIGSSKDVSGELQKIIDNNPNKTIFFPDGDYHISKPILTPANPHKSVSLKLSNYAKIIANDNWNDGEALIKLGGKDFSKDIRTCGSNYFLDGGILDGAGIANGVSIDSGRETVIRNVSIKHTKIGIHIKRGANNGSSDADVTGVNIVGNQREDSVGVLIEGWDNTLTNIRIADVFKGVVLKSSGNMLRNIHPLYTLALDLENYENNCGFECNNNNNWFDYCYSDQFACGFVLNGPAVLNNCFCWWYSPKRVCHIGIKTERFDAVVMNFNVGFNGAETENIVLKTDTHGEGIIQNLIVNDKKLLTDDGYKEYLNGVFM